MELILNGDTISDSATPEAVHSAIHSLTGEGDSFAILAGAEQHYIQTSGDPENGFILEYRDGSEAEHYSCTNPALTAEQVIKAFSSYLAQDDRYKTEFEWELYDFSYSGGPGNGAASTGAPKITRVFIYVVALLSVAAGVPKVMQMPEELGFLSALGLEAIAVSILGVVQVAGGVLFALNPFRIVGAVLAGAAFLVSSVALLAGGNVPFGLISLLPIAVLLVVLRADRRARD